MNTFSETKHHGSNGEELSKNDEISDESSSCLSQEVTTGKVIPHQSLLQAHVHPRSFARFSHSQKIAIREFRLRSNKMRATSNK